MADANVTAAWKVVHRCQAEAMSIAALEQKDADPQDLLPLAVSLLSRFTFATESLERAMRDGGMGAVAPMVTKVVDGQLSSSRT